MTTTRDGIPAGTLGSIRAAADLLDVDVGTVERLIKAGKVIKKRIGNKLFVDLSDVERECREDQA
jgi:hypothetical protein